MGNFFEELSYFFKKILTFLNTNRETDEKERDNAKRIG